MKETSLRRIAFGVPFEIRVPTELEESAASRLPPGSRRAGRAAAGLTSFELALGGGSWVLRVRGRRRSGFPGKEAALEALGDAVERHVALRAPGHLFVHAGVVALGGRALVLPGRSGAGKTRLVTALVAAGASYASDEWAVIGSDGRVYPFPRPLRLRTPSGPVRLDARETDARIARGPLRLALLVVTRHRPGAALRLDPLGPSRALLALLAQAPAVRERPNEALPALRRAVEGAAAFEGTRGEADAAAPVLLRMLRSGQRQSSQASDLQPPPDDQRAPGRTRRPR